MAKTLCTLVLLLIGHCSFSFPGNHSDFSEAKDSFLPAEEPEKLEENSEIDFSAGLQKDLHRVKIILVTDFSSFRGTLLSRVNISNGNWEFTPNLTTAKILYPFHSFP